MNHTGAEEEEEKKEQQQHDEACRFGETVVLRCEVRNFDTGFPELKVYEIEWKRLNETSARSLSTSDVDFEIIKDGRAYGTSSFILIFEIYKKKCKFKLKIKRTKSGIVA